MSEGGKLAVADRNRSTKELVYGPTLVTALEPPAIGQLPGEVVTIRGKNFAPDSVVVIGEFVVADLTVDDSETITLRAPAFEQGRFTVTVRHRGGLAQTVLVVESPGFDELPPGYITTIAGGPNPGGDGSLATAATIAEPASLAIDDAGNLFVAEPTFTRVRKIDAATGIITTIAGTGQIGVSTDGGLASASDLIGPVTIALDRAGNLLVGGGRQIRRTDGIRTLTWVTPDGQETPVPVRGG